MANAKEVPSLRPVLEPQSDLDWIHLDQESSSLTSITMLIVVSIFC